MSVRSLFLIILKIIGLFFIKDFFVAVPQLLTIISMLINFGDHNVISPFIAAILSIAVYGFMAYLLLFKTGWVIDKLTLDKGFEVDAIRLNMHRSTVLSISIIVIGALMVANAVPPFIKYLVDYYGSPRDGMFNSEPKFDWAYIILYGLPILAGLLLMGNQRQVVNCIELKRLRQTSATEEDQDEG